MPWLHCTACSVLHCMPGTISFMKHGRPQDKKGNQSLVPEWIGQSGKKKKWSVQRQLAGALASKVVVLPLLPCSALLLSSSECLTVSIAFAASLERVPPLTVEVVDAVASEASLGRGVLTDGALSKAPLPPAGALLLLKCKFGRAAVSSSRLGWPMSLLAAGSNTCMHKHSGATFDSQTGSVASCHKVCTPCSARRTDCTLLYADKQISKCMQACLLQSICNLFLVLIAHPLQTSRSNRCATFTHCTNAYRQRWNGGSSQWNRCHGCGLYHTCVQDTCCGKM